MTMTNGSEQPTESPTEGNGGAQMALTSVNESTKAAESKVSEGCQTAEIPSYTPIRCELIVKPGASSSGYASIGKALLASPAMTSTCKLVLLFLIDCMGGGKNYAYPGHETIASNVGMSVSAVKKAVGWLEEHGFLVKTRRGRTSNLYRLTHLVMECTFALGTLCDFDPANGILDCVRCQPGVSDMRTRSCPVEILRGQFNTSDAAQSVESTLQNQPEVSKRPIETLLKCRNDPLTTEEKKRTTEGEEENLRRQKENEEEEASRGGCAARALSPPLSPSDVSCSGRTVPEENSGVKVNRSQGQEDTSMTVIPRGSVQEGTLKGDTDTGLVQRVRQHWEANNPGYMWVEKETRILKKLVSEVLQTVGGNIEQAYFLISGAMTKFLGDSWVSKHRSRTVQYLKNRFNDYKPAVAPPSRYKGSVIPITLVDEDNPPKVDPTRVIGVDATEDTDIPVRYRQWQLEHFSDEACRIFVGAANKTQSTVISGGNGTGKSSFAAANLMAIRRRNRNSLPTTRFITYPDFAEAIMDFHTKEDAVGTFAVGQVSRADNLMTLLKTVDILVFDDLGNGSTAPNICERLCDILLARYAAGLKTLITTNCNPDDLGLILNEAVMSRISEGCWFDTGSKDLRPERNEAPSLPPANIEELICEDAMSMDRYIRYGEQAFYTVPVRKPTKRAFDQYDDGSKWTNEQLAGFYWSRRTIPFQNDIRIPDWAKVDAAVAELRKTMAPAEAKDYIERAAYTWRQETMAIAEYLLSLDRRQGSTVPESALIPLDETFLARPEVRQASQMLMTSRGLAAQVREGQIDEKTAMTARAAAIVSIAAPDEPAGQASTPRPG